VTEQYDSIIIGGGHAGTEAAWAAAHMGASVALVTMQIEAIGRMSCNPAIGGLGKGQMVREIDALGGLMGLATDAAGIQFRMLNRSKGAAVQAPRAQADRHLYACEVQKMLSACPRLTLVEGLVDRLLTSDGSHRPRVRGVRLVDGRELHAPSVVITTGTFMRGLMHCGEEQTQGGRVGEASAEGLSAQLLALGIELGRLKTGTPPRVHRDSVNYDVLERQPGDDPPVPFSFMVDEITQPQVPCWIAYTCAAGHGLIRNNLHRAPMYSGQITATGVRYCPSIEDKIVRFADKPRHQVFLEPEGYDNERMYCNGLGTSLPRDVQEAFLRTIAGLEKARILQYGYAVEYDFVPTHQTGYNLESKRVEGLFLAGQINGTSGYEEAAGQGLMAGINSVRKLQGQEPVILGRDQAYIGVMIDDLMTRPPDEPYRMFTSRAEYRLLLRSDNADERLTPLGRELGLVGDSRWTRYQAKAAAIEQLQQRLASQRIDGVAVLELLRRPEVSLQDLAPRLQGVDIDGAPSQVREQVQVRARYSGYVARMQRDVQRLQQLEGYRIPSTCAFQDLRELRNEARERFSAVRPQTLGQASRISGITPADISVLWIVLEARRRAAVLSSPS
jgi:tRNA uridine 5-carboxymethylaminomethyl modification enzyme